MNTIEELQEKVAELPEYADLAHQHERERQLTLVVKTIGRRAGDVARFEDKTGDDIIVWFFSKRREPEEGERVVALVVMVEQGRQRVKLEEVIHRGRVYFLEDGTNFVLALRDGAYAV